MIMRIALMVKNAIRTVWLLNADAAKKIGIRYAWMDDKTWDDTREWKD